MSTNNNKMSRDESNRIEEENFISIESEPILDKQSAIQFEMQIFWNGVRWIHVCMCVTWHDASVPAHS